MNLFRNHQKKSVNIKLYFLIVLFFGRARIYQVTLYRIASIWTILFSYRIESTVHTGIPFFFLVFQACLEQCTGSSLSRERTEYFADDPHQGLDVVSWFEDLIVIMINNNYRVWWHCRCVAPYKLWHCRCVAPYKLWHCRCVTLYKMVTLSLCCTLQKRRNCRCVTPYKLCRHSQLSSHPFLAFVVIDVWTRVFSVQEVMGNWSCGCTFECVEQGCVRWEGCRDS